MVGGLAHLAENEHICEQDMVNGLSQETKVLFWHVLEMFFLTL